MSVIKLEEVFKSKKFQNRTSNTVLPIGYNEEGDYLFVDLKTEVNVLVAGMTGSGKTNVRDCIVESLIHQNNVEGLKFILFDPKRVYFSEYKDSSFLKFPIINTNEKAFEVLRWCHGEMDRRVDLCAKNNNQNIFEYNKKKGVNEPAIVLIFSETADFMRDESIKDDFKRLLTSIMQMAGTVGIYTIFSAQCLASDIVTKEVQDNTSAKIFLKVNSEKESRDIMGKEGAEELDENEMFFKAKSGNKLHKLHSFMV